MNEVNLIGTVTKKPQTYKSTDNITVAKLILATTKESRDSNTGDSTEFHLVAIYGKQAEYVASYVGQGSELRVKGELRTRPYKDNDGKDVYVAEVVVKEQEAGVLEDIGRAKTNV